MLVISIARYSGTCQISFLVVGMWLKTLIKLIVYTLAIIMITSCRSRNDFSLNDLKKDEELNKIKNKVQVAKPYVNTDTIYKIPDVQASFHGGDYARVNFFKRNLKFPEKVKDSIIELDVIVSNIVICCFMSVVFVLRNV